MIDRTLGLLAAQQETYYFQLIPSSLTIINQESDLPPPDTTYRFTVFKGQQKFDQNRTPIQANFNTADSLPVLAITTSRLNFYVPSVNRQRRTEFSLKLVQREQNVDYELGEYIIDVNQLVQQFKVKKISKHAVKANFSEDYELQFVIYVDTSRANIEKSIKEKDSGFTNKSPSENKVVVEHASGKKKVEKDSDNFEEQIATKDVQEVSDTHQHLPKEVSDSKQQKRQTNQSNPTQTTNQSNQKIEKIEASVQSKDSLPKLQIKYKPISKITSPAALKTSDSQRLSIEVPQQQENTVKHKDGQSSQQKILLWIFLGLGFLFIYWAMHPNSRA